MRPPPLPVASQQRQCATTKMWHDNEVAEGGTMTKWHDTGPNDACTHIWANVYLWIYLIMWIYLCIRLLIIVFCKKSTQVGQN